MSNNKLGTVDVGDFRQRNENRLEIRVDGVNRCFVGLNTIEIGGVCTASTWVEPESLRTELGWETCQMDWAVATTIVVAGVVKFYEGRGWRLVSYTTEDTENATAIVFTFRRSRSRAKK